MPSRRFPTILLLLAVAAMGTAAWAVRNDRPRDPAPVPTAGPVPRVVTVAASNYAFEAPDTLPAGPTTFRLNNHGPELHHIVIVPLTGGHSTAELMQQAEGDHLPAWALPLGGPNAVDPGGHGDATVDLAPGRYVMICVIPAPDGMMHLKKGMAHEFTVVPAGARTSAPAADLTVRLNDYSFTLSAPLTVGHHEIAVQNDAAQPHELVIFKLAPGKHLPDFLAWFQKPEGPPPASALGGASPLATGRGMTFALDVTPGTYGLICFLPDAKDGAPHLAHGMMQEFEVR